MSWSNEQRVNRHADAPAARLNLRHSQRHSRRTPDRIAEIVLPNKCGANAVSRLNTVEEVARFVVFLTRLQNVSGQIFPLDSRIARWT